MRRPRTSRRTAPLSLCTGRRLAGSKSRPTISCTIRSWVISDFVRLPLFLPSFSTMTRSAISCTSASRWEINTTASPRFFRSRTTSNSLPVSVLVRLLVGSSMITSLASRAMARAISTICRCPMERDSTSSSGGTFNPTRSNKIDACSLIAPRSNQQPPHRGSRPRKMFSATLRFPHKFSS